MIGRLLGLLLASSVVAAGALGDPGALDDAGDRALGERLYRDGILASGEEVTATLDTARVSGPAFHCQACHRRSGYGSLEGAVPSPPVVGDVLFAPRRPDRAELHRELFQEVQAEPFSHRARDPRLRPAYDEASLATVLRSGVDPAGRELDPWMPRYDLGEEDVRNLAAYLRELGRVPDPGVNETEIHFATVVAPKSDPEETRAFLDVMEAYVGRKNAELDGLRRHMTDSSWNRQPFRDSWRTWRLHVWRLEGPESGWTGQLRAAYDEQPVFAILSGLVPGTFEPVHRFCEAEEVPCLFPHTDLPVTTDVGAVTLYLSPGLTVEAEALAAHLGERSEVPKVLQVFRQEERSRIAARAFAKAWDGRLTEQALGPDESPDWQRVEAAGADVVVAWLDGGLPNDLPESLDVGRLFLSTTLVGTEPELSAELAPKVRLMHRFALPGREVPRIHRVHAWLRSRGVASAESELRLERIQLDTFFALTAADYGLHHLVTRFDRDFFVEAVEHEAENALNPGTYPRLSLGPGQRFASKGCWVVRLGDPALGEASLEPVSGWILP